MKLLDTVLVCRVAVSTQELLEWGRNLKVCAVNRVTFFFQIVELVGPCHSKKHKL